MWGILALGFVIGLCHALEADHVAAVAALAAQSNSVRRTFGLGAAWGIGHALPLLALGVGVLVTGLVLPDDLARWLDIAVGGMLVLLGADVLRRMTQAHVHVHVHRHRDGVTHLHAHAHEEPVAEPPPGHEHRHGRALTLRAVAVGTIHGLAGSGALILLTLPSLHSVALGLTTIALFALGSLAGMTALTAVIALPLRFAARRLTVAFTMLQGIVGLGTCALGARMVAALVWP